MKRLVLVIALLTAACEREERGFRVEPPRADRINSKQLSTLQPGEPVLAVVHGMAGFPQAANDEAGDPRVVLDDQYAHGRQV